MEGPAFAIDGQLHRVLTFGSLEESEDQNSAEGPHDATEYPNLRALLRDWESDHTENDKNYWPDRLLRQIITTERIEKELRRLQNDLEGPLIVFKNNVDWYTSRILPPIEDCNFKYGAHNCVQAPGEAGQRVQTNLQCYLKIFALLLICERCQDLDAMIDAHLCDSDLPLEFETSTKGKLIPKNCSSNQIECFSDWPITAVERFRSEQYQLLTPYFPYDSDSKVIKHVSYRSEAIMPWKKVREKCKGGGYKEKCAEGGYGLISCIEIHPASHGFHGIRQVEAAKGRFALKHITTGNIKDFENESKMLRMFSNHHDHFVKLLMTFSISGSNYLLFPWAECDLENFWGKKTPPYNPSTGRMDYEKVKWLSKQIVGIVEALHIIHNPENLAYLGIEKRWARHGDLKPQNILWFKSDPREDGILVIGDLGISSAHRKESRSNIPNHVVPVSPDYRPPECDQEGGKISRAFDIWTLGCLLLEMVCWTLGGKDLKREFERARLRVPYIGTLSNIFFDVKTAADGGAAVMVKEIVVQWMSDLHEKPGCTQYFHDLLQIIHDDMILVLSKNTERIRSGPLLGKIKELHQKISSPAYGQESRPRKHRYDPPVAVATTLNGNATSRFELFHENLAVYDGVPQKALTPYEMAQKELDS